MFEVGFDDHDFHRSWCVPRLANAIRVAAALTGEKSFSSYVREHGVDGEAVWTPGEQLPEPAPVETYSECQLVTLSPAPRSWVYLRRGSVEQQAAGSIKVWLDEGLVPVAVLPLGTILLAHWFCPVCSLTATKANTCAVCQGPWFADVAVSTPVVKRLGK